MLTSPRSVININGELLSPREAKISVFDRGFLYGDSIYEVTQTIDGVPFFLDDHLERLYRSGEKIGLVPPYSPHDLRFELGRTLKRLGVQQAYIRYIITRGEGEIGLDPNLSHSTNLVIITKELKNYPKEWYTHGVHVIVADTKRTPTDSVDPNVKSGNYLNNVIAYAEAAKLNAFDALMLNHQDEVTEATTSNVWIVDRNNQLLTPPLASGILEGITRKHLIGIAQKAGLEPTIAPIARDVLDSAKEIFLTSTTKRLVPVTKLNQQKVGNGLPGPFFLDLSARYDAYAKESLSQEKPRWDEILSQLP